MTQEITTLLAKWQKRLALQDWIITVELVPGKDLTDKWGNVYYDEYDSSACIKLTNEADRNPEARPRGHVPTVEESLLHELLEIHLHRWKVPDDSLDDVLREQVINKIVRALIA